MKGKIFLALLSGGLTVHTLFVNPSPLAIIFAAIFGTYVYDLYMTYRTARQPDPLVRARIDAVIDACRAKDGYER